MTTDAASPSTEASESDETPAAAEVAAKPKKRLLKKPKQPRVVLTRQAVYDAVSSYTNANDRLAEIREESKARTAAIRAEMKHLRAQEVNLVQVARSQHGVDSIRVPLPDGKAEHLTIKSNSTYRNVTPERLREAITSVSSRQVMDHRDEGVTLAQALIAAVVTRLKRNLVRTLETPHATKGPPSASRCGNTEVVIAPASEEVTQVHLRLIELGAELRAISKATAADRAAQREAKKAAEPIMAAYLKRKPKAQDRVTLGTGPTAKHFTVRCRTNARKPQIKVGTLETGKMALAPALELKVPGASSLEYDEAEVDAVLADAATVAEVLSEAWTSFLTENTTTHKSVLMKKLRGT